MGRRDPRKLGNPRLLQGKAVPTLYVIPDGAMTWESAVPATPQQIDNAHWVLKGGDDPVLWVPDSDPKVPTITSCRRATNREIRDAWKLTQKR